MSIDDIESHRVLDFVFCRKSHIAYRIRIRRTSDIRLLNFEKNWAYFSDLSRSARAKPTASP
jgi:hypothetical protein